MARDNYSFKKHQKELAKKKKREEKQQRKLERKTQAQANPAVSGGTSPVPAQGPEQASKENITAV